MKLLILSVLLLIGSGRIKEALSYTICNDWNFCHYVIYRFGVPPAKRAFDLLAENKRLRLRNTAGILMLEGYRKPNGEPIEFDDMMALLDTTPLPIGLLSGPAKEPPSTLDGLWTLHHPLTFPVVHRLSMDHLPPAVRSRIGPTIVLWNGATMVYWLSMLFLIFSPIGLVMTVIQNRKPLEN